MTTDEKVRDLLVGGHVWEPSRLRDVLEEVQTTLHDRADAIVAATQACADTQGQLDRMTKHARMLEIEVDGYDLLLDQIRNEVQLPNGNGFFLPWLAFSATAVAITIGVCWVLWG